MYSSLRICKECCLGGSCIQPLEPALGFTLGLPAHLRFKQEPDSDIHNICINWNSETRGSCSNNKHKKNNTTKTMMNLGGSGGFGHPHARPPASIGRGASGQPRDAAERFVFKDRGPTDHINMRI